MLSMRAFTIIELMVVIAVLAILTGILVPALDRARRAAMTSKCLSNLRNMEVAHWGYMTDHKDRLIRVGLSHGSSSHDESLTWVNTLESYYGSKLLHRSPADDSLHWGPDGDPVPGTNPPRFRLTSYGVNNFLDQETCPDVIHGPYLKSNHVPAPSRTVHFLYMTHTGPFAGADHPHVENWVGNIPVAASSHLQIDAHGGPRQSWRSVSNYGFLDGHAATLTFESVYRPDGLGNSFDPQQAR